MVSVYFYMYVYVQLYVVPGSKCAVVSFFLCIFMSICMSICECVYLLYLYGTCWHEMAQITIASLEFTDNKRKLKSL